MLEMAYLDKIPPLLKTVAWIGSSLDDLRKFPAEMQQVMGFALYRA